LLGLGSFHLVAFSPPWLGAWFYWWLASLHHLKLFELSSKFMELFNYGCLFVFWPLSLYTNQYPWPLQKFLPFPW
jgi:hypothetical protein